jgi:homocitrate synthase NifV
MRAQFASVTITGIGERTGNASMEEAVMFLKQCHNYDCGINIEALPNLINMVQIYSKRTFFH